MNITLIIALALLGLCMGSFAAASVWRLRARQLSDENKLDSAENHEYAKLKKLAKTKLRNDRSMCLDCSYKLRWFDLIPLVSWITLKGKCRKCHAQIGYLEPLSELFVAAFFVLSYIFWPFPLTTYLQIAQLALWLIAGIGLAILFIYDQKWYLLPDKVNFSVIAIGVIYSLIAILMSADKAGTLINIAVSIVILSGIYWLLYMISKGKWIGFGDIKLGLGLALLLADWQLAFVALFSANLIGCVIVLPALLTKKLKRNSHVPFGPLLIVGFVIAGLVGHYLIDLYLLALI